MIFSEEWGNFSSGYGNLIFLRPGRCQLICVYQGIQPSIEDYVTNYSTLYDFTSPNILQLILKSGRFTSYNHPLIETDPESETYTQALKSFRSGTATWASIVYVGDITEPDYNVSGYYFLSDSEVYAQESSAEIYEDTSLQRLIISHLGNLNSGVIPNDALNNGNAPSGLVSIVPVSDMTDNGVIKFRSIEFSNPDESDEDRAIDMSLLVSINNQE
jgi:hypothetical protein